MHFDIKKRIESLGNSEAVQFFFGQLKVMLDYLEIGPEDPRLALTVRNDNRKRISVNINGRLVFCLKNGPIVGIMLNESDISDLESELKIIERDNFKEDSINATLVFFSFEDFKLNSIKLVPLWLKSCESYLPTQVRSQYRHRHIPELYAMAMDETLLNEYLTKSIAVASGFKEIISELIDYIKGEESEVSEFEFQKIYSKHVWISDHKRIIGDSTAHYEIREYNGLVWTVLHFEGSNESQKEFYSELGNDLPSGLIWTKWRDERSISTSTKHSITDKDVVAKICEQLVFMESTMGEKVRAIIKGMKRENAQMVDMTSLNQILFGPPGTGKTYTLQNSYFSRFTQDDKRQTKEEYIATVIAGLSWWEVIALVLLEGESSVPKIKEHEFIKAKLLVSKTKSLNQTVWGQLSSHTVPISKTVEYTNRFEPFIFDKLQDSKWFVVEEREDQIKDLISLKEEMDQFKEVHVSSQNFMFTTFHQSMSYEDFIEGIKPAFNEINEEGSIRYSIKSGIFYRCCDEASKLAGFVNLRDCIENHTKEERSVRFKDVPGYALFIDEINRGNVSQIFGELITLIEDDKRLGANEILIKLPYSKLEFGVPPNLYIIGTMNTADRSVEALDTALRRRFSFVEMPPQPELEELKYEYAGTSAGEILSRINARIEKLLDKDHLIGHSFFIRKKDESEAERIHAAFTKSIIPLLQEYFFGDYGKIGLVLGEGFVRIKTKDKAESLFAKFVYDNADDYLERDVYEIIQYDDLGTEREWKQTDKGMDRGNFEKAIRVLMNQKID